MRKFIAAVTALVYIAGTDPFYVYAAETATPRGETKVSSPRSVPSGTGAGSAPDVSAAGGTAGTAEPAPAAGADGYAEAVHEVHSALITAEGGRVVLGSAEVDIPAGALERDTEISITRLTHVQDTGDAIDNATAGAGGYRFLPAGMKFKTGVTVKLPYDPALNTRKAALETLCTWYYDTGAKKWIKLERTGIDRQHCVLESVTTHFTDMINGTLALPESQTPLGFNINSIKNLEAADPQAGVVRPEGLQGGPDGSASFRFSLPLTAGRAGMTPQVAPSIRETAAAGYAEKGFGVQYGSVITTDTRLGLPAYDGEDRYMKDGIDLIRKSVKETGSTKIYEYTCAKETEYGKILRYRSDSADYWVVLEKNGRVIYYGDSGNSWTGAGSVQKKFSWYETKESDPYGNSIVYEYEKDGAYVYPSQIRYTDHGDEQGNYTVSFRYDTAENGSYVRPDVRTDGRGKFLSVCGRRLTDIETAYRGTPVRRFHLMYAAAGETYDSGWTSLVKKLGVYSGSSTEEDYGYAFTYRGLEKGADGNPQYFAAQEQWSGGGPLHVSNGTSTGVTASLSSGAGYGTRIVDVRLTTGGQIAGTESESWTGDTLADMNGDGRPDLVYQRAGTLYIAYNTGSGFSSAYGVQTENGDLDAENSTSNSYGWNVFGGAGVCFPGVAATAGGTASQVYQSGSSYTKRSIMDMNGDGLPDIAVTDANYYLKNNGAAGPGGPVSFTRTYYGESAAVAGAEVKLTAEQLDGYNKNYYVQTPVRIWRALFGGTVNITQTVKGQKEGIRTLLYEGTDTKGTALVTGNGTVTGTGTYSVSPDKEFYFLQDTGSDTRNTDVDWNIAVTYTKIQPLLVTHVPVFVPECTKKTLTKQILSADKKAYPTAADILGTDALVPLYTVSYSEPEQKGSSYNLITTLTLKTDWETSLTDAQLEAACSELVSEYLYVPGVVSGAVFAAAVKKCDTAEKLEKLAQSYSYDCTTGLYMLNTDTDSSVLAVLLPLFTEEALALSLDMYRLYDGILPLWCGKTVRYGSAEKTETSGSRTEKGTGCVLQKGTLIPLGTFNGKEIAYRAAADGTAAVVSTDGTYSFPAEFTHTDDSDCITASGSGYTIVFTLSGLSRRTEPVFASEMDDIKKQSEFAVAGTDVTAAVWQKDQTEDGLAGLLGSFTKTDGSAYFGSAEIKAAESALYTETEETSDNGTATKYWKLKDAGAQDRAAVQSLLSGYADYCFFNRLFPFYTAADSSGTYYTLRADWQTEKTADDFASEIPGADGKPVKIVDEAAWKAYDKQNTLLKTMLELEKIGRYKTTGSRLVYDTDYAYGVSGNTFSMEVYDGSAFTLAAEPFGSAAEYGIPGYDAEWNSGTDFSDENLVTAPELTNDTLGDPVKQYVNTRESMYGGRNGWYYAVWKGTLSDNPFSAAALYRNADSAKSTTQDEFSSASNTDYESEAKNAVNTSAGSTGSDAILYYLPSENRTTITESAVHEGSTDSSAPEIVSETTSLTVTKEAETGKEFSGSTAVLLGTVANTASTVTSWSGSGEDAERVTSAVQLTYAPFIEGDYIHTNRAGGPAYYAIPGIAQNDPASSSFVMPSLRASSSSGTDTTYGVSFDMGFPAGNFGSTIEEMKDAVQAAGPGNIPGFSLGGTVSTNDGTSTVIQSVQDMDGDGIPDIVNGDGSLSVIYGSRSEDGTVSYGARTASDGAISHVSTNESSVSTKGGTVSPGGSVSPKFNAGGKCVGVSIHGGGNGSGGFVYANGTSTGTAGFTDINGDGLPDYYNGGFLLSEGGTFVPQPSCSTFSAGSLSEGTNETCGANFSFGKALTQAQSLNCGVSGGLGLSYSASASNTERMLLDINGDGLEDIVTKKTNSGAEAKVRYNTGSGFTDEQTIPVPAWDISNSMKTAFGLCTDGNLAANFLTGIPVVGPALRSSGVLSNLSGVALNPYALVLDKFADSFDFSTTLDMGVSGNLSANWNMGFDITTPVGYFGTINITVDANGGVSGGASLTGATVKMTDMDGDGLPDQVLRIPGPDGGLWVKRNLMGGADLVTGIASSTGASWSIGYELKYGTENMPQSRYVMASLTVKDGCAGNGLPEIPHGAHSITTAYSYGDGYYNRMTKDFYGYGSVTAVQADGSCTVTEYYNDEYYRKEMEKSERTYAKENGTLLRSAEQTMCDSPDALVKSTLTETYEENSSGKTSFLDEYEYDGYGNAAKITESMNGNAYRTAVITYWEEDNTAPCTAPYVYLHSHPETVSVYGADGTLLRKREGTYKSTYGTLKTLKQYMTGTDSLTTSFTYDSRGNTDTVRDAAGITLSYTYDSTDHEYVTGTRQQGAGTADAYTSGADWYHETGAKKSETDINGNVMQYAYDSRWRLAEVRSPYDTGSTPAVSYRYYTYDNLSGSGSAHGLWYTVTDNKITFGAGDSSVMETVIVSDGTGRQALTAKRGEKYSTDSGSRTTGWNVSGCAEYDEKGRQIKQYMNRFVTGELADLLSSVTDDPDGTLYTAVTYDALDRVTEQTLPDGSVQTTAYSISGSGENATSVTDPLGNMSIQYTDPAGNITETGRGDKTGKELTKASYVYDAMGQMTQAYDAKKNAVTAEYNLLGQKTSLSSPDTGKTNWYYDSVGRLFRQDDPVMRGKGEQIKYGYDAFSRLILTDYPKSTDCVQEYGAPGADNNGAGKVIRRSDESGSVSYEYGKLGELTQETRSIVRSGGYAPVTAVTGYGSDYLGRMQHVTYPDGETVAYMYDTGGNVQTVTGTKTGYDDFTYVKDTGYDEYGQRVYIQYGNGTSTTYTYDPARRWLKSLVTVSDKDGTVQNMQYAFDTAGNVSGYTNACGTWETDQSYTYDALYQLIKVEGSTENRHASADHAAYNATYSQTFAFSDDGLCNMTGKTSKESEVLEDDLNYTLDYEYDSACAHRAVRAGKRYYRYDANGNLVREQDKSFADTDSTDEETYHLIKTEADNVYSTDYGWARMKGGSKAYASTKTNYYYRDYTWNERNLLRTTKDDSYTTEYLYGGDGERAVKRSSVSETLYFNKFFTQRYDEAYMGAGGRMSKHIFLGNDRIVTKQVALSTGETYDNADTGVEKQYTYYYHANHLDSTSVVTDSNGEVYERLEYTPYGETWLDETSSDTYFDTPYRFSAKEKDQETGLYYYGARYLDPKYSRWISADPALGEYLQQAPVNDEAKKHNQSLPGQGGVFNVINLNLYHYAGNNPIKYTDPDGKEDCGLYKNNGEPGYLLEKALDQKFAETVQSMEGVPYLYGGKTREGIDCSGTVTTALNEMGYDVPVSRANRMADGKVDWITINSSVNEGKTGDVGMLNFYKTGGSDQVNHVNVGIGEVNIPGPPYVRKDQIIDATEGSTLNQRAGRPGQYTIPKTGKVNQTYAPFSTNTQASVQGKLNWAVLENKYKMEE